MKKLLFTTALVVCVLGLADAAPRPRKAPKAVTSLKGLCKRQAGRGLTIDDGNYTEVFEDLEDFCTPFLANFSDYYTTKETTERKYNPIRVLGQACKWFGKKYPDGQGGIWTGFDEICESYVNAFEVSGVGINVDPPPPKAILILNDLCVKSVKGRLRHKNESYDSVFEDFGEFCVTYVEAEGLITAEEEADVGEEKKDNKVIRLFGKVCSYIIRKYDETIIDGSLVGLDEICDDFVLI